jgi:hypothetical protein
MASRQWCCGLGAVLVEGWKIMPDRSMEIKRVDEETISYHALYTFDFIV